LKEEITPKLSGLEVMHRIANENDSISLEIKRGSDDIIIMRRT
jgi:hypothetical protein